MLLNSSAFCAMMMNGLELMLAEVSKGPASAAVEASMTRQLRIHIVTKVGETGKWLVTICKKRLSY